MFCVFRLQLNLSEFLLSVCFISVSLTLLCSNLTIKVKTIVIWYYLKFLRPSVTASDSDMFNLKTPTYIR